VSRRKGIQLGTSTPLLVERAEGCRLLGDISYMNALRLEKLGVLKPIKPHGGTNSKVYYGMENLLAIARGDLAGPKTR
jgi:hypothetical protein